MFKPGEVVVLKSGGPLMTVKFHEEYRVACTWFDSKGQLQVNEFGPEQLELEGT